MNTVYIIYNSYYDMEGIEYVFKTKKDAEVYRSYMITNLDHLHDHEADYLVIQEWTILKNAKKIISDEEREKKEFQKLEKQKEEEQKKKRLLNRKKEIEKELKELNEQI